MSFNHRSAGGVPPWLNAEEDPDKEEREALSKEPGLDQRGRNLVLDPKVSIKDARDLVSVAKRLAAGYRKTGFGSEALDSKDQSQALSLTMGAAHIENGGVVQTAHSTVFGAPRVVHH